jgi:hypothetical protein
MKHKPGARSLAVVALSVALMVPLSAQPAAAQTFYWSGPYPTEETCFDSARVYWENGAAATGCVHHTQLPGQFAPGWWFRHTTLP